MSGVTPHVLSQPLNKFACKMQAVEASSSFKQEATATLAAQASSLQAERRAQASLQLLLDAKERDCNEHSARNSELEFELMALREDLMMQKARQGSQDALVKFINCRPLLTVWRYTLLLIRCFHVQEKCLTSIFAQMQMKRMQQEMSAAQEAAQQAQQLQEVLSLETHRAQGTARQVLNQLAEDRDSAGFKASRLCGIIHELRAEKRDLITKV